MNDPLEQYRDTREEAVDRGSRQHASRSASRAPGARRETDSESNVSRREAADGLRAQIQTLHPILKWTLALLLLLLFVIACQKISSLTAKKITDPVSHVLPIRNCDKEVRHLLDFHRFDSSTEQSVDLKVPTDASIGLYARNWVDSHKHWLLEEYSTHVDSILKSNFQPVQVPSNITDYALTIKTKTSLRARLEDPEYVRKVLDKLLQYESAKSKEFTLAVHSDDFNRALKRYQEDYKDCHLTIATLNKDIEAKLRHFENPTSEIDKSRHRMNTLKSKIEAIDADIPAKRRNTQKEVDRLEDAIVQMERDLTKKTEIENEIADRERTINKDERTAEPINKRIKELESLIGENEELIMDFNSRISELQPNKSAILIKISEFESQLSIKPVDNQDLCDLVRGVGKCEKNNLETAKEFLNKVQEDTSKFKEDFGIDSVIIEDLNQENIKVKDLANEFENLVNRAEKFPHRRIEALSSAKRKVLEGHKSKLQAVQDSENELARKRQKAEDEITSYRTEMDGLRRQYDDLKNQISTNNDWISQAKTRITGDPRQLEKLRSDKDDLIENTEVSIRKLTADRVDFKTELDGLIAKVGPLEDLYSKYNTEITALITKLNVAMNDCKRIELLLKKFEEESRNASSKIEDQKTRLSELSRSLTALLQEIEAI